MHEIEASRDVFGAVKLWMVILSEVLQALCTITGDKGYKKLKDDGVNDNINSLVARIMMQLRRDEADRYLGGQKLKDFKTRPEHRCL